MSSNHAPIAIFAAALMIATPAMAESRTYAVSDFTSVSAAAGVEVDVTVGADYAASAESTARGLERLEVKVVSGELRIRRINKGFRWTRGEEVTVTVSMPSMTAVSVSSGASIDVRCVDAGAFAIDASSGGDLDISGRCDALTVDVSSGASVDADSLECRTASADASSGGSADINVSEEIVADASSGGSIDVAGSPKKVSKNTSSGGSVDIK